MILDELDDFTEDAIESSRLKSAKLVVGKLFWIWYNANVNRKLTSIKLWIFSKSIYVKDLKGIFILLFGPENGISEGSETF